MTASNFSKTMQEEATKLPGETKKEPPVLTKEDQEIKQLEDRNKELRKQENRSVRLKAEYIELIKTVERKSKHYKDHERNKQIMLKPYFKVVEDQKGYTKEDQRKRYLK